MSLDSLRDAYFREKTNEIAQCAASLKRKLRELYGTTALLNAGRPLQAQDLALDDEPDENEARFLDENDITKRRRFNDATLPPPLPLASPFQSSTNPDFSIPSKSSPTTAVGPSLEEQLRAASASPSVATQRPPPNEELGEADASAVAKPASIPSGADAPHAAASPADTTAVDDASDEQPQVPPVTEAPVTQDSREAEVVPDGPAVDPRDAIPPSTEDETALAEDGLVNGRTPKAPRAPQVVHLPPQEVQEARLQERERKLEKAAEKERKEEERLALPNSNVPTDLASSPSSTVGPYSQATPHPQHHSPDTSPDTESFRERRQSLIEAGLVDPVAEQAKEDHERALQEQMRLARESARAESTVEDDVERQIEDEQAIRLARDGKARLGESDNAPPAGPDALSDHARDVVREIETEEAETAVEQPAADSLPTPTTTAPEPSTAEPETSDSMEEHRPRSSLGQDHPTPPADNDVEMDEAPVPVKEQLIPSTSPRSERMTTRDSSGALQQKSITQIIEERAEKSPAKVVLTPRSSNTSLTTSPARPLKEQKRKEVSTVIFAKPDLSRATKALQLYNEDYASLQGASQDSSRDYLQGLFNYQAHHPPRSTPLMDLVTSARKTVSTAGVLATIREAHDYKILKRVYQLQNANRWSLRQLKKSAEPERPITHQDHLLAEMKWMQTDFKEERSWKKSLAATFAVWCADFVNSTPEERTSLRIKARLPKSNVVDQDMDDAPTPDLVHSGADAESVSFADDDELLSPLCSNPPATLFSLGFNDVVMKIDRTPASDAMLHELPLYEPILEGARDVTPLSFVDPPLAPVSKFVCGKLVSQVRGPPRKRSRYEYDSEDEPATPPSRSGTSAEHSMPSTPGRRLFHRNDLPPEMSDVALFHPENRHIRDRLQASHQFRPPTEFPMPSVSFFENRQSSQWLWEEDQKLRALVKEYTFNWSLVAQQLALPSMLVAGSGRRTPWECFERWVQLEGLPAEMSKTQYFRTYQSRLEQAQRTVAAQHQAQQQLIQQQQQSGQSIPAQTPRRRTNQPIRVERRRDNRHLAIIDGMRKLARKRESIAHKQAESQKAAALRKAQEPMQPKTNVHTPQEFSRLKWEREQRIKQKLLEQQQQEMHARQMAQRTAQMQAQGLANGAGQQQRMGTPGSNPNLTPQMANAAQQGSNPAANAAMAARAQQNQMQQGFPNANMNGGMSMGNTGVPQAQMQANMSNSQRMGPPNQAQMAAMQRGQYPNANQQHQFQLQQQQINMASNLTQNMGMNNMPNANMMASMAGQNMNGNITPTMNGMSNNAGSPRINQATPSMQTPARPLSSGHMPQLLQIQNNLKVQHPEWSQEQVQKMASDHLARFLTKQRAQAMNAAAGSPGMAHSPQIGNNMYVQNGNMGANSPNQGAVHAYQQQLVRQQQMMSQQRAQAGSPGINAARPSSRSATPQNPQLQQSPGVQQAQT
ncbi:RNA polymerase II transcription elongation factor SpEAF [Paraconiothyrium brasiliense]|uniref:Vacuolar import and degradation protein 21 n=1 Tax=Paraconiothyrium brasiliense TaxID=300254 RepID=A0ABR3QUF9_9PLEO